MPDISMCANKECELKETCYRYRAIPSRYLQSYADFQYEKDNCLIPIKLRPVLEMEQIENEK